MHGTLSERRGNEPDLRRIGIHPDYWYPLACAKDVEKGKTLGVSFAGEPIVLVRTESSKIYALEDRCAHRQMPLSCGVVAGELIKCCYHAWAFNAEGRCSVPYLPKGVAMPRGVRAYPSREAYGLIFVFPGNPALADQVSLPDVPLARASDHLTLPYAREVKCHYSFMHENLMDMNHQFLHRRWLRKIKPTLLDARKQDGRVEVDYKFELVDGEAPMGSKFMLGEKDPENRNYDIMTVSTQYPYQLLTLRRPAQTEPVISLWSAYVPLDAEQRRNQTFGLLSIRKPKIPGLARLFAPVIRYFTEGVFTEDRFAVEAEQRAHDAQGADWNQEILPFMFDLRNLLIARGVPIERTDGRPPVAAVQG